MGARNYSLRSKSERQIGEVALQVERQAGIGILWRVKCKKQETRSRPDDCFLLVASRKAGSHFKAPHHGEDFRFLQNAVGFFGSQQDGLYELVARHNFPLG